MYIWLKFEKNLFFFLRKFIEMYSFLIFSLFCFFSNHLHYCKNLSLIVTNFLLPYFLAGWGISLFRVSVQGIFYSFLFFVYKNSEIIMSFKNSSIKKIIIRVNVYVPLWKIMKIFSHTDRQTIWNALFERGREWHSDL